MAIALPIVTSLGGSAVGGWIGGSIGASIGGLIGAFAGQLLFPPKAENPTVNFSQYPLQSSAVGYPIAKVYGTVRLAGRCVWLGSSQSYTVTHKVGGGIFGLGAQKYKEVRYRRSFMFALCNGPARVIRIWKDTEEISSNGMTFFLGNGNTGMATVVGKEFASYPDLCCVLFQNYDLGQQDRIPNFVFEVTTDDSIKDIITMKQTTGGIPSLSKIRDNLDGTFTEQDSQVFSTNANDDFPSDGNDNIYVQDGTTLKKYDRNFDIITSWQTSGTKYIGVDGARYPDLLCVDRGNNYVYVRLSDTLYCLDENGDEVWNASIHNISYPALRIGVVDANHDFYAPVNPTGVGEPLIQKFDHTDGTVLKEYYEAAHADDTLYGMAYNEADDSIVITRKNFDTDEQFVNCFDPDTGTVKWTREVGFNSTGYLGHVYCDPYGNSFVCSGIDGYVYWFTSALLTSFFSFLKLFKRDIGSVQKYNIHGDLVTTTDTGVRPNWISGLTRRDIVIGQNLATNEEGSSIHVGMYSDNLEFLRGYSYGGAYQKVSCIGQFDVNTLDANPADIIKGIITDPQLANQDESLIVSDSYDAVYDYCEAQSIALSIALDNQQSIHDWLEAVNSHFFGYETFIDGQIRLGVLKDEDPTFDILQDDLVESEDGETPPVQVVEREKSQTYNHIKVRYTNQADNYKMDTVIAEDVVDQRISGQVRERTIDLPGIQNPLLAQKIADRFLAESMYRFNTFTFRVSYKFSSLMIGTVGTLSDGDKLDHQKIRILEKTEIENGKEITIVASEEFSHIYTQPSTNVAESNRDIYDQPTVIQDSVLSVYEESTSPKINLCIAPVEDTNGWQIFASTDGSNFGMVGEAYNDEDSEQNASGLTASALPAYGAVVHRPDEYVVVDLAEGQSLETATDAEFFSSQSLMKISEEIIGYNTVEDISDSTYTNRWRITGLIRGMFNTDAIAHSADELFGTLIPNLQYEFSELDVGKVIYFVVVPFYGSEAKQFDQCQPFPYTIVGRHYRPAPVSILHIDKTVGEGYMQYSGTSFDVEWQLASKTAGWNTGGFNYDDTAVWKWSIGRESGGLRPDWNDGLVWGYSDTDPTITQVVLRFYRTNGTVLGERYVDGTPTSEEVVKATDLSGESSAVVGVLPVTSYRTWLERQITVKGF